MKTRWPILSFRILLASVTLCAPTTTNPPPLMAVSLGHGADLRSLPRSAGVAFLASSITLDHGAVEVMPRFQPLRLTAGTFRMAVIRMQTVAGKLPLTAGQRREAIQTNYGFAAENLPKFGNAF